LTICTNGSSKPSKWWAELNEVLTKGDKITFAIDGLEDTNHLYRKNAKWPSIMEAVKVLSKRQFLLEWKFIVFKHNQHQINEAKVFSDKLGFDNFRLEHSDRWLGEKDLMPDSKYVDYSFLQANNILEGQEYTTSINPTCLTRNKPSNDLYIDAEGNFYPCCWMGTYRYKFKSIFSPKNKKYNISDHTLENILNTDEVKKFFQTTNQFTSAHECCKIKCGVKNG
jgi:MoaA/NifB/PqqE/SkfB family radical SAM enzyme